MLSMFSKVSKLCKLLAILIQGLGFTLHSPCKAPARPKGKPDDAPYRALINNLCKTLAATT